MISPVEKPYDFWDTDGQFRSGADEFFVIFKHGTAETRSTGYWSAEKRELLWLAESYLMFEPDTVYYVNKPAVTPNGLIPDLLEDSLSDVSAGVFFDFIKENTPQCMEYVLFHLSDMRLA